MYDAQGGSCHDGRWSRFVNLHLHCYRCQRNFKMHDYRAVHHFHLQIKLLGTLATFQVTKLHSAAPSETRCIALGDSEYLFQF
jgi:hypothetical protein